MADFSALKTAIQANIRTNGNEEITGAILQEILLSMVSTMGDGAINALSEALQEEITNRQNAVSGEATTRAEADSQLSGRINAEAAARGEADTQLGNSIAAITTRLNEGYVYAGIATPSANPGTPAGKVFYIALQAGTYTNFSNLAVTQGISILKYDGTSWLLEQVWGVDDKQIDGSNNLITSDAVAKVKDYIVTEWNYGGTDSNGRPITDPSNAYYLKRIHSGYIPVNGGEIVTSHLTNNPLVVCEYDKNYNLLRNTGWSQNALVENSGYIIIILRKGADLEIPQSEIEGMGNGVYVTNMYTKKTEENDKLLLGLQSLSDAKITISGSSLKYVRGNITSSTFYGMTNRLSIANKIPVSVSYNMTCNLSSSTYNFALHFYDKDDNHLLDTGWKDSGDVVPCVDNAVYAFILLKKTDESDLDPANGSTILSSLLLERQLDEVDLDSYALHNYTIAANGKWQSGGKHIILTLNDFTAGTNFYLKHDTGKNASSIAFLKEYGTPVVDSSLQFCDKYNSRILTNADQVFQTIIPMDCKYIYIAINGGSGDNVAPKTVLIDNRYIEKVFEGDEKSETLPLASFSFMQGNIYAINYTSDKTVYNNRISIDKTFIAANVKSIAVSLASGYQFAVDQVEEDGTHYTSGWKDTGNEVNIFKSAKYFFVILRKNDNTDLLVHNIVNIFTSATLTYRESVYPASSDKVEEIETAIVLPELVGEKVKYVGKKVELNNQLTLQKIFSTNFIIPNAATKSGQGSAIYGKYMFMFGNGGQMTVLNINDWNNITVVGTVASIPTMVADNHANVAQWGAMSNSGLPYLYVSAYNSLDCTVIKITVDETSQTPVVCELAQTIHIDDGVFPNGTLGSVNIGDDGYIYFSGWEGTNLYFTKFKKVSISDGATVTLTQADVVDQWIQENYDQSRYGIQSFAVYRGKFYFMYSWTVKGIWVYDIESHVRETEIDLSHYSGELEDLSIVGNAMYITFNNYWYMLKLLF